MRINREFFGDGSMRQIAPISSALHLGAKRVLIIGTGHSAAAQVPRSQVDNYPSLAQIAGHALNSIFLDSVEADLERLKRINHTVSLVEKDKLSHTTLGHVGPKDAEPVQSVNCVGFITTLLRGTEWAASGKVTLPVPAGFPTADMTSVR